VWLSLDLCVHTLIWVFFLGVLNKVKNGMESRSGSNCSTLCSLSLLFLHYRQSRLIGLCISFLLVFYSFVLVSFSFLPLPIIYLPAFLSNPSLVVVLVSHSRLYALSDLPITPCIISFICSSSTFLNPV
jgi:hypothetical protein